MEKYYFGIDVGGTFIKGGVIDKNYKILAKHQIETKIYNNNKSLCDTIMVLIKNLEELSGLELKNASGIGIGLPGLVDNNTGIIKFINCLNLKNYNIKKAFAKVTDVPVQIANDAECATVAEHKLGAAKNFNNFVMLTLGTGIGSGVFIDGKTLRSSSPFACEIGHTKITANSNESFENLASTKALVSQTKAAMENDKNSKMWKTYNLETVNGKTIFEYKDIDTTAKEVFNNYIANLGRGIINIYNTFSPEAIVIGGGVSAQKDNLIKPLTEYINEGMFTKNIGLKSKIITAKLTNDAGILGASCLFD